VNTGSYQGTSFPRAERWQRNTPSGAALSAGIPLSRKGGET